MATWHRVLGGAMTFVAVVPELPQAAAATAVMAITDNQ